VAQPGELIGERAMVRMLSAIDGTDVDTTTEIVPHRLVVRQSTAACAAQSKGR
jgi:DNA-binding LacI/PurR family transcriptional regulator